MGSNEHIDNNVPELDLIHSRSLSCIASKTEDLCLRLYNENRKLRELKRTLSEEIDVLRRENESLSYENESLKRETDEFRAQRNEFRSENEVLRNALNEKENLFKNFAKQILKDNSFNIPHNVVNSLPCFTQTHTPFGESLPISLNHCSANDSYSNLKDLRLAQSKDQNAIPSQTSSMSNNTSASDTYVTADSRPSIPAAQNAIRSLSQNLPSTSQTNHVNSVNGSLNSSHSTDDRNNIRLKPTKVIINRQIDVDMAFIENAGNFWLHVNYGKVNNYIHHIQVTQENLLKTNDYKLTCKDIYVGMYCVAIYSQDGEWYRAQVIAINYEPTDQNELFETVKVIYVDWGNTETVHISKITRMTSDLAKRKQAIKCYLQGMQIDDRNREKEIIDEFKRLISGQRLCAVLNKPDNEKNSTIEPFQHIYPVDLIIINENGIVNVVESLYAKHLYLLNSEPDNHKTSNNNDFSNDLSAFNGENELTNKDDQNILNETKISNTNNAIQSNTNNVYLNFNGDSSKQHNSDKSDSTIVNKEVTANLNSFQITNDKHSTNSKNLNNVSDNSNSDLFSYQIPPPIIPTSDPLTVMASYIDSPSEFFVHIHGDEGLEVGIAHLDDLIENLQTHYSQSANQLYVSDISHVKINSFWVCLFREDDIYYRVRVISINGERVKISYVDYGNTEFVSFKELIPLTRRFASYPALCVKCSLRAISPLSDNKWSAEATETFIKLTDTYDKVLTACIYDKPEKYDFNSKLEVGLWTIELLDNEILINSLLLRERLAHTDNMEAINEMERVRREKTPPETSKLIKGSTNSGVTVNNCSTNNKVIVLPELIQEEDEEDDDDWDPKADDYFSARNNYAIDVNDPSTATLGYRLRDVSSCKFFGTAKGCFSGNRCQFLHIAPEKRFAIDDKEEEHFNISGLDLDVGAYYIFKVTGIQSPNSFYGILPFGEEPYRDDSYVKEVLRSEFNAKIEHKSARELYTELKKRYSKLNVKDTNPDIFKADGSLVVARVKNDANDEKSDIYFRARVLHFDDQTNKYKLFNIDSGFNIIVSRSSVFKLEKYFAELPALAVHCALRGIEPYSSGSSNAHWSQQAIDSFTDWALNKLFCVQILSNEYENKVEVDLIQYIDEERESITEKLIHHKFAQYFDNFRDDEIYPPSDID